MKNEALEAIIETAFARREGFAKIEAAELGWTDAGAIVVAFDDGAAGTYTPEFLRAVCPCAECRGSHGGPPKAFNVLSAAKVRTAAQQTVIKQVEPIGNYALGITWGDGHKEGIYTWSYLRGLAEHAHG